MHAFKRFGTYRAQTIYVFGNVVLFFESYALHGVLVHKVKTLKKHVFFSNVFLGLYIECFSRDLLFRYIRSSKTLIIHMSDDILSFPNIEYFCIHFGVFVRKKLKNNQNPRFGNILFVCKGSFVCVSPFLYGRGLKALKIHFSFFMLFCIPT